MTEKLLQLDSHEVWRALATIDPVAALAEELIGRAMARVGHEHSTHGRLVQEPVQPADPVVVLEYPEDSPVCVMSATSLRAARAAALAALAARELLIPGGVTVAVLGITGPVQSQLALIARHVPDISHVALWTPDVEGSGRLDPELVDQLELSGIGLSVAPSVTEAVFGANLVFAGGDGTCHEDPDKVADEHTAHLGLGHLARGTVLVNATGRNLPSALLGEVDRVYVDDLGLLAADRDRRVGAALSDLAQMLTGKNSYRQADDVVLVELLGAGELNVEFAYRIYQAAWERGLGTQIFNNGR